MITLDTTVEHENPFTSQEALGITHEQNPYLSLKLLCGNWNSDIKKTDAESKHPALCSVLWGAHETICIPSGPAVAKPPPQAPTALPWAWRR